MAAEKNFETKIKKFLETKSAWFLKYWGGAAYTKSGIPDLLVCLNGHFLGIEVKAANGKPSPLQIHNLIPFIIQKVILTLLHTMEQRKSSGLKMNWKRRFQTWYTSFMM